MSFDQFNQDETLTLRYSDENGRKASAITIADRDTRDIYDLIMQRDSINKMTDSTARAAACSACSARGMACRWPRRGCTWAGTGARRRCSICSIRTGGPAPAEGGFARAARASSFSMSRGRVTARMPEKK